MKKYIKEYLHFYLGCDTIIKRLNHPVSEIKDKVRPSSLTMIESSAIEFKPILRPLSDLTEAEAMELGQRLLLIPHGQMCAYKNSFGRWVVKWGSHIKDAWCIDGEIFNQHQTIYLLKQGFDIFGLIEAGIAIDKTIHGKASV